MDIVESLTVLKNELSKEQYKIVSSIVNELETSHKQQITNMQIDHLVQRELKNYAARNVDMVSNLIDKTKIDIDENGFASGLVEQIEALKEKESYLFDRNNGYSYNPQRGEHFYKNTAKTLEEVLNTWEWEYKPEKQN